MAFSNLTLSRSDIDSFEGQTFQDVYVTTGSSTLNISEFDDETLTKANEELKTDILEKTTEYLNDDTYSTQTELLDALYDVDDENLLKNLLAYKFFELWFFQDANHEESFAFNKFRYYRAKYQNYLSANIKRLSGLLDQPKDSGRIRMRSTYS